MAEVLLSLLSTYYAFFITILLQPNVLKAWFTNHFTALQEWKTKSIHSERDLPFEMF